VVARVDQGGLVGEHDELRAVAHGLLNTSRQIGGAIGLAVLVTVAATATATTHATRHGTGVTLRAFRFNAAVNHIPMI
jgi:hypothetical protein